MGIRFASYPTQSFGWWIGLNGRYQSDDKSVGGEIGISYFGWRRLGGQLSFSPTWSGTAPPWGGGDFGYFTGVFSLSLFSRT